MTDTVSTTGRIRLTIEIDWPHTFDGQAKAADIYQTVARECETIVRHAFDEAKVKYRIIGEIEPLMVILPVKRP